MIRKLYVAADHGVQIDLIVRGICCLVPRKNINIVRVVDRFLEHSRVYCFNNGGEAKIYLGSADWMDRNLYRRIEVVFPLYDPGARHVVLQNIEYQLADNAKGVVVDDTMTNVVKSSLGKSIRAQHDFYNFLSKQI